MYVNFTVDSGNFMEKKRYSVKCRTEYDIDDLIYDMDSLIGLKNIRKSKTIRKDSKVLTWDEYFKFEWE